MPRLSDADKDILEDPITIEELQGAVGATKQGKASGPDGLTARYYKTLLPSIAPYMVKVHGLMHWARLQNSQLTLYLHTKEGKDPTSCGSYRPISLLNLDLKLFIKILANRIQHLIPSLIHLDHVGFVHRHSVCFLVLMRRRPLTG